MLPKLPHIAIALMALGLSHGAGGAVEIEAEQSLPIPPRTELATEVVKVPIKCSYGQIVVKAKVNGEGPFSFLLDTGTSGDGRIDTSLVTKFGLRKVGLALNDDGTGSNVQYHDLVFVDSIQIGGAVFRGLKCMARDYGNLPGLVKGPIMGILSFGLFSDLLLTIDYHDKEIQMQFGDLTGPDRKHVTPYMRSKDGLFCLVDARLGSKEFQATIDTGHEGGLNLPGSYMATTSTRDEVRLIGWAKTANNSFAVYGAQLAEPLQVAGHSIFNIKVTFAMDWDSPNIGYEVLRRFSLTFDQKNQLLRFDSK
ncbi:MAG: retropepsin-like aspartic protease [Candidatus Zixiibacteriota bacterium]